MAIDDTWLIFFAIGLGAQLVDGALGMAFGVIATSLMLASGMPAAQASALVHLVEMFTTAASGASHVWHRNVDWSLVRRLALPGALGGLIGATLLANLDGKLIQPAVALYLLVVGGIILLRAAGRLPVPNPPSGPRLSLIGGTGGFLDAIGGGGWGPFVTATLIGHGHPPRFVIGAVNLSEFLVTTAISAGFLLALSGIDWSKAVPLALGGLVAAPFAGYMTRVLPLRPMMLIVGCLVMVLSGRVLLKAGGFL